MNERTDGLAKEGRTLGKDLQASKERCVVCGNTLQLCAMFTQSQATFSQTAKQREVDPHDPLTLAKVRRAIVLTQLRFRSARRTSTPPLPPPPPSFSNSQTDRRNVVGVILVPRKDEAIILRKNISTAIFQYLNLW